MFGGDSARFFLFYSYLLPFSSASYFSLSAFSQSVYLFILPFLFISPSPSSFPSFPFSPSHSISNCLSHPSISLSITFRPQLTLRREGNRLRVEQQGRLGHV